MCALFEKRAHNLPAVGNRGQDTRPQAAETTPNPTPRWTHLERAHIPVQPDPWLHTCNHIAMFTLAVRQCDRRKTLGQIVRIIVAAPGSLAGITSEVTPGAPLPVCAKPCPHHPTSPHC